MLSSTNSSIFDMTKNSALYHLQNKHEQNSDNNV